jgi:hypothetical protein
MTYHCFSAIAVHFNHTESTRFEVIFYTFTFRKNTRKPSHAISAQVNYQALWDSKSITCTSTVESKLILASVESHSASRKLSKHTSEVCTKEKGSSLVKFAPNDSDKKSDFETTSTMFMANGRRFLVNSARKSSTAREI